MRRIADRERWTIEIVALEPERRGRDSPGFAFDENPILGDSL